MHKSGWPSWEQCSQDGPFVKKHKLFYNFTNITIKMVKFDPNSISCILKLLWSFNRPFQLYIVGYTMSVLGGGVRLRHVPLSPTVSLQEVQLLRAIVESVGMPVLNTVYIEMQIIGLQQSTQAYNNLP